VFYYDLFAVIFVIFLRFIDPYLSSSESSADSGFNIHDYDAVSNVIFFSGGTQVFPKLDRKSFVWQIRSAYIE